jgi:hypothetical protein
VGVQSLQYVVSSISCARRPREVVRLRSPIVLFAHGSGRARCERAEHEAWAVAQSLQYVVSSISCARRPRGLVRLRSPMVLSTPSPSRARDLALPPRPGLGIWRSAVLASSRGVMRTTGKGSVQASATGKQQRFCEHFVSDCGWVLFGKRDARNQGQGHSVY